MTGGVTADIVLPIVIAVALTTWLSLLFYANAHPSRGQHSVQLPTEVRGGEFQAVEGGRQLMPIPEHRPAVPGQRAAAAGENYQVPERTAAAGAEHEAASEDEVETRPMAGHPPV
ncbi:MAG TPA: hypothetical protein VEV45_15960 [Streptosporangiaceae bacterium]|nr:hypothetical protein [Streptosporangiaceae bacterium]